jgi:peptidoglycan/LPS O-acetylase OafA/YrhL
MPALNALMLGTLMYRSRLVPRVIPAAGLIGAPLLISSAILAIFGITITIWSLIAVIPIFFWELALGVWMVIKGFNQSVPLMVRLKAGKENES